MKTVRAVQILLDLTKSWQELSVQRMLNKAHLPVFLKIQRGGAFPVTNGAGKFPSSAP